MQDFWQAAAAQLERELTPQQFKTWIKPLAPVAFDEEAHALRIAAPNRFKLDWVKASSPAASPRSPANTGKPTLAFTLSWTPPPRAGRLPAIRNNPVRPASPAWRPRTPAPAIRRASRCRNTSASPACSRARAARATAP
ncbi:DnaA N-terminal domain-containing protein [Cupriavidus sp. D39]|uniref:DnaA N-terminal domain-containing protein n=1 Tax=Cupriavidus sp. D39 TaxID=2997877 RepID=UPI003B641B13